MPTNSAGTEATGAPPSPSNESLLAQFNALRTEMETRGRAQHQLLALVFIVSGPLLTLGVTYDLGRQLFLLVPLFLVCLAAGWASHDKAIKSMGGYIRCQIEPVHGELLICCAIR